MKKFLALVLILFFSAPCFSASIFQGGVSEEGTGTSSRIIDRNTGVGVGGANVILPKQRYSTKTDANGYYSLKDISVSYNTSIVFEKTGYSSSVYNIVSYPSQGTLFLDMALRQK